MTKPKPKAPAKKAAPAKKPAPRQAKPAPATPKRKHVDKEAVERDYRLGKFTLRELGDKHGCRHSLIAKWAKEHSWAKDLTKAVKAATDAKLIEVAVTNAVNSGEHEVNTVLAAAEVNKQVILRHREDVSKVRGTTLRMLHELDTTTSSPDKLEALFDQVGKELSGPAAVAFTQQVRDLMRLHARIGSVHKVADTLGKLQPLERRAFGLDDDGKGGGAGSWEDLVGDIEGAIGA